jgi:hypothetical protein
LLTTRTIKWLDNSDVCRGEGTRAGTLLATASKNFSGRVFFGKERGLRFCPFGDIYPVGHALAEYVDWKRTFGTETSF